MTGIWLATAALVLAAAFIAGVIVWAARTRDGKHAAPRPPSCCQRLRAHRWRLWAAWDRATARAGHWWHRAQYAAGIDLAARYRRRHTPADERTIATFERMNGRRETPRVLAITQAITASRVYLAVMLRSAPPDDGRWPHLRRQWQDDTGSFPALIDGEA